MHSAQTAWLADQQNQRDFTGGWLAAKFHLYSWALSVHCLIDKYASRTLVADSAAADLLIGQMGLPYDKVDLALDNFENPFPAIWVLKKTLAYARQPGPFVHLDSDAYLFAPLLAELVEAPLIAQNQEFDHPYYLAAQKEIDQNWFERPEWVCLPPGEKLWAFNAGLVGGAYYQFYAHYHEVILRLLLANEAAVIKTQDWYSLNVYVEQAGMVGLARQMGLDFQSLMPGAFGYPCVYNLDQFWRVPNRCGYLHAMNYKCEFCEKILDKYNFGQVGLAKFVDIARNARKGIHERVGNKPAQ